MKWSLALGLVSIVAAFGNLRAAEPLRLPIARDAWISAFPGEQEGNNGGSPRLKLKGIQEFSLIDFDSSSLRGKEITRAELWLHLESKDAPLGRITVSTVAVPWEEGTGNGYEKNTGASFRWAAPGRTWLGPGSDLTFVVSGEQGTIWGFGDASPPDQQGWQVIPVDPRVIEACAAGESHGLFLQDDTGSEYERDGEKFTYKLFPNRYMASRDMNRSVAPYLRVWVGKGLPEAIAKIDPTLPKPVEPGKLPPVLQSPSIPKNALLHDLTGVALENELYCAKNEAIAFLITRRSNESVEIETPGCQARLYGLEKDVLRLDNNPQRWPAGLARVVGEIYVPHAAEAGDRVVTLRIGGKTTKLPLHVWDFTLPDHLSFVPEMNAYGLPCATAEERHWYRLAHEHRLNLNVLRYGWNGRVNEGCAPTKTPKGWDWTAWDAHFGPLLDGTAFKDLPRAGVSVDAMYLPLNEDWPADVHRHFRGGYWIEDAFDPAYWDTFRGISEEIGRHVRSRGWNSTWLQFYLNNKLYYKQQRGSWSSVSAPWVFDEPVNTQDFWALRRYGQEFNAAARPLAPNCIFRCDISRSEWQRDLLDGVTGIEVVSGAMRPYRDRILRRQRNYGTQVVLYGATSPPAEFSIQPAAWCLDAWCWGADGVLPWQTVGKKESWDKPDALSLFYPRHSPADPPVSGSVRLKSYRQGQQLVEYLTLYTQVSGQTRDEVAAAVEEYLDFNRTLKKQNDADAGTTDYGGQVAVTLLELRQRLGQSLHGSHPASRKRLIQWKIRTDAEARSVVKAGE